MQNSTLEIIKATHIFPIIGKIFSSPYNWGGRDLIPNTLGFTPEPGVPYAEYWIGAHKRAPSLVAHTGKTLEEMISDEPEEILGAKVAKKFDKQLPYLFKLSEPKKMLSVQVHPNKEQAVIGFAEEEKSGIPATELRRTYKDPNSKTEMALAIGDFWLLHGLRPVHEMKALLNDIKEFEPLKAIFGDGDYKKLYKHILVDMSAQEINDMLGPLVKRIVPRFEAGELKRTSPDYWAAKGVEDFDMHEGAYDRGLFSIYFLNLVHLKPSQAIFQDAGVLHAFLYGSIVEILQNSDNLARAGMTNKPIDIDGLMKFMTFAPHTPHILDGRRVGDEVFYDVPAEEYLISKITLEDNKTYTQTSYSAEILMGLEGNAKIISQNQEYPLGKGDSVFVITDTDYEIKGTEHDIIYRLSVPQKK